MFIASGSDNNVSLRHSPMNFPEESVGFASKQQSVASNDPGITQETNAWVHFTHNGSSLNSKIDRSSLRFPLGRREHSFDRHFLHR